MRYVFLYSLMLLTSCMLGPNYQRPASSLPSADSMKHLSQKTIASYTTHGEVQRFVDNPTIPKQWWTLFHCQLLNDLIETSLHHHPSVPAAEAALHAALETMYAQRSTFFPTAGAVFSPSDQKIASILTSVLANNQYTYSLYTGQLYLSYVPDVFGGTRRQVESLVAQAEFQRLQLEATYLTLMVNVANAAISYASFTDQIIVAQQMIKTQSHVLTMLKQQHALGDAALTDIYTQEAALAATKAILPSLEKQRDIQQHLLYALMGHFPEHHTPLNLHLRSFRLPTDLPLTLPSTLLEHRPDIRAAENKCMQPMHL